MYAYAIWQHKNSRQHIMHRCAAASQAQRVTASHANRGSRCTAMGGVAVIMHLYATCPEARAGRCSLAVT